jgi:serine/threonine-protein kinase
MEYVEGETLRSRIFDGPLSVDEAVRVAIEIAEALDYAHSRGIVHRDLKPANVVLTAGDRVKLLDFGIAQWLPEPGTSQGPHDAQSRLTLSGMVVGTPAYMSPEQLCEQPATARSDVFALGIVLYEMLTGIHPFLRNSAAETAGAILNEDEEPLRALRPDIPDWLDGVVHRMLSKDPRTRYASAGEAASALVSKSGRKPRRWLAWLAATVGAIVLAGLVAFWALRDPGGPSPPPHTEASIAVLPFVDLSPGRDLEFFCDGISEQIISSLTRIDGLSVTARTSAFSFKGRNVDAREIGSKLGVAKLLEGSVRRLGDRLRITVQLVKVADGYQIWSRDYERSLGDLFEVQDEIAREVARSLQVDVTTSTVASRRGPVNPEANQAYLKGRYFWAKRTAPSLESAVRYFEEAIEHDPGFALAYVGLADTYSLQAIYGSLTPSEAQERTKRSVSRALALDDSLAEAHASLAAHVLETAWNWEAAEREYRRTLEIQPGNATVHCWYGTFLMQFGRYDEALAQIRRAVDLDPLSPYVAGSYGWVLTQGRRYEEAAAYLQQALELDPEDVSLQRNLAYAYAFMGKYRQADAAARKADTQGKSDIPSEAVGYIDGRSGRKQAARSAVARLIELWGEGKGSPGRIAVVYLGLGEHDKALEWLEKAYDVHDAWLGYIGVDPIFDPLRSDPRFRRLLERVGLPPTTDLSARRGSS